MEKIFVLGNSDNVRKLGFNYSEIPNLINDCEIHNWVVSLFENNDIDKLVIEIGKDPELSLKIAFHIRLSLEELKISSLIPVLFISNTTLHVIILSIAAWSNLFATKGVYFSIFDNAEKLKIELSLIEGITINEYKSYFLNIIKVLPDETIGRHSLANIWGAFMMDKAANTNALFGDVAFQEHRTKLYFKYVQAFNFNMSKLKPSPLKIIGKIPVGKPNTIDASNKKILLIDDEADKGWEIVLRKVFKTTSPMDFVVINEKVKDYESFSSATKNLIENTPFNLYLVDLRLNGTAEENTLKTSDFSGMKVLQKIKSLNQGNQVIIFTASNKVWNLKALLDVGADGYYMKESPEFGFTTDFSEQNYARFKEDVKNCFNRNFLSEIFQFQKRCNESIKKRDENNPFYHRTIAQLEISFELLNQTKNPKYYNFAYLTYYQILEDYTKLPENFRYDEEAGCYVNNELVIDKIDKKWKLTFIDKSVTKEKYSYFKSGMEEKEYENPFVLAKISFILAFKFSKDNTFLKEWGRLNSLRNTVAVHGGNDKTVTVDDINSLLRIVELLLI